MRMATRRVLLITEPDVARQVLQDHGKYFERGMSGAVLEPLLGKGLLTSEGEVWRRQRRLAQPAFHRAHLSTLTEMLQGEVTAQFERIAEAQGPMEITGFFQGLALRVVAKALFGTAMADQTVVRISNLLGSLMRESNANMLSLMPLPPFLWTPRRRRIRKIADALRTLIRGIIEERRQHPTAFPDLLNLLLSAHDQETDAGMSDELLRDEVMTLLMAGHETTASALAWATILLARNPHECRRAHEEATAACGSRSFEELFGMERLGRIIDETLRLYPPAWIFSREITASALVAEHPAYTIGNYVVRRQDILVICPYILHRDDRTWPEADHFDPDRFSEGRLSERQRAAYLPFGAGPRQCIGNNFARLEMLAVLSQMLSRFRPEMVSETTEPEPLLTLRPRSPVFARFHPA